MYVIIIVLACAIGLGTGSPIPIDVPDRSIVTLPCFSNGFTVNWIVNTVIHPHLYQYVYESKNMAHLYENTGRYRVTKGKGWYNLTISDISIADVGTYECELYVINRHIDTYAVNIVSFDNVSAYDTSSSIVVREGDTAILSCSTTMYDITWLYVGNAEMRLQLIDTELINRRGLSHF